MSFKDWAQRRKDQWASSQDWASAKHQADWSSAKDQADWSSAQDSSEVRAGKARWPGKARRSEIDYVLRVCHEDAEALPPPPPPPPPRLPTPPPPPAAARRSTDCWQGNGPRLGGPRPHHSHVEQLPSDGDWSNNQLGRGKQEISIYAGMKENFGEHNGKGVWKPTTKGKGHSKGEICADRENYVRNFDPYTGERVTSSSNPSTGRACQKADGSQGLPLRKEWSRSAGCWADIDVESEEELNGDAAVLSAGGAPVLPQRPVPWRAWRMAEIDSEAQDTRFSTGNSMSEIGCTDVQYGSKRKLQNKRISRDTLLWGKPCLNDGSHPYSSSSGSRDESTSLLSTTATDYSTYDLQAATISLQ